MGHTVNLFLIDYDKYFLEICLVYLYTFNYKYLLLSDLNFINLLCF